MRNDSNKSSPLLGDDDESEQERRWVDEGSRRKIAAPRMQATSASPSPCAEISDGPSRAEHGDGGSTQDLCPGQRTRSQSLDEAKKQAGCVNLTE